MNILELARAALRALRMIPLRRKLGLMLLYPC